jgi:hypothetical protein
MNRWCILRELADLVQPSGLPPDPPTRWRTLQHVAAGAARVNFSLRETVGVLPQKLDLDGEIIFRRNPGVFEVLVRSLVDKRPAFVLRGSLACVIDFFGLDDQNPLPVRVTASGLVLAFGHVNGAAVAVHAALNEDGRRSIRRLCRGAAIGTNALPEFAPVVLASDKSRVVTALIDGQPHMPWGKSEETLQLAIVAALRPLETLYARRSPAGSPDIEFVRRLASFVQGHERKQDLSAALAFVENWDRSTVGGVTVHGDYWLNNLLASENRITGIVDWDRARLNGCAAIDALHLGFMSYAMWADLYVSDLLASLWTGEWQYPWLAKYSELIGEMFQVSFPDMRRVAAILWLSYFYYADDGAPRTDWNARMIEPVCRALASQRAAAAPHGAVLRG